MVTERQTCGVDWYTGSHSSGPSAESTIIQITFAYTTFAQRPASDSTAHAMFDRSVRYG
jgi:hypothetical protein